MRRVSSLTDCGHASRRQTGLLDAPSSPVGSENRFRVAERAIGVTAGQLPHRVSDDTVRPQTQLPEQVNLSDLEHNEAHTVYTLCIFMETAQAKAYSDASGLSQLLYRHDP